MSLIFTLVMSCSTSPLDRTLADYGRRIDRSIDFPEENRAEIFKKIQPWILKDLKAPLSSLVLADPEAGVLILRGTVFCEMLVEGRNAVKFYMIVKTDRELVQVEIRELSMGVLTGIAPVEAAKAKFVPYGRLENEIPLSTLRHLKNAESCFQNYYFQKLTTDFRK
jgi:hypothetical protein